MTKEEQKKIKQLIFPMGFEFDKILFKGVEQTLLEKEYQIFITNFIDFFNKFYSIDNINELFFVYNYMLYNNYLSVKDFEVDNNTDDNFFLGKLIATGIGNYNNINNLFLDILNKTGNSSLISLPVDIYLNDNDKFQSSSKRYYYSKNHNAIFVNYNNQVYLFDPSKEDILIANSFINNSIPFECSYIFEEKKGLLIPESLVQYNWFRKKDLIELIYLINNQQNLNVEELKLLKLKVIDFLEKHKVELEKFFEENYTHIKTINNIIESSNEKKKEEKEITIGNMTFSYTKSSYTNLNNIPNPDLSRKRS